MTDRHAPGVVWAGRYDLLEAIASTGMSSLYRATDLETRDRVAVKILDEEVATPRKEERFVQEIRIAEALDHPRIVPVIASGSHDGVLYYVMPFLEGESLRSKLGREGPLGLAEIRRIVSEVGEALAYAHEQGVVHRDIKPDNLLLTPEGTVVLDFGIARVLNELAPRRLTQTGVSIGTPSYMSPEQASANKSLDARSDQYSLACVVYEMLVGEPPFTGPTERVVIARQIAADPPSVSIARPDLPAGAADAVHRALLKAPSARHSSIGDFVRELHSDRTTSEVRRSVRGAVAAVGIGAVALLVFALMPRSTPLDANRVIGFPLTDVGEPSQGVITGVDVALWLGIALQQAYPLKWVDAWDWMDPELRNEVGDLTGPVARDIAESLGAARYLTGMVQHSPDSTRVVLRLWDVAGDTLVRQTSAASAPGRFGSRSALDALSNLMPSVVDPGREIDLTFLGAREPAAIASWIEGDREYRSARFAAALSAYSRALELDSLVAPAALKAAQSASWLERRDEARALIQVALRHEDQLSPSQNALANGFAGYLTGDAVRADSAFRVAVSLDSDWPEAWMGLGEANYHLIAPGGDTTAHLSFSRSAELDPQFTPPLLHLFEIAVSAGDQDRMDTLAERVRAVAPDPSYGRQLQFVSTCAAEGPGAIDWNAAVRSAPLSVRQASRAFAVRAAFPMCAEAANRALLEWEGTSAGDRFGALKFLNGLLVAQGRHDDVLALVDAAYEAGLAQAGFLYMIDATVGVPVEGRAEAFEQWLVGVLESQYGPDFLTGPQVTTLWALAAWGGSRGDVAMTAEIAAELARRLERDGDPITYMAGRAAEGWASLALTDTAAAIEIFADIHQRGFPEDLSWELTLPMGAERLSLAELLLARGQFERAIEVASTLDHPQPVVFLAYMRRGLEVRERAATAMGRRDEAEIYRERLNQLSGGMDPP